MLVEIHTQNGKTQLCERFGRTHSITVIEASHRRREDFPYLPWYTAFSDPTYMLVERHLYFGWLWMVPQQDERQRTDRPNTGARPQKIALKQ
jgi:hypothetical protein